MLSMWSRKLKFGEEKSKHAGLAQQNGFGAAFLHNLLRFVKGTAKPNMCPAKSVINWIWLLLLVFDWSIIMIGPCSLLLVIVSHLFAVLVLVFIGGCWKKVKYLNLDMRNIFAGSHSEQHWWSSYCHHKYKLRHGIFKIIILCVILTKSKQTQQRMSAVLTSYMLISLKGSKDHSPSSWNGWTLY
jgi:hypothetical protein